MLQEGGYSCEPSDMNILEYWKFYNGENEKCPCATNTGPHVTTHKSACALKGLTDNKSKKSLKQVHVFKKIKFSIVASNLNYHLWKFIFVYRPGPHKRFATQFYSKKLQKNEFRKPDSSDTWQL